MQNRELLEEPFEPSRIRQREGSDGQHYDYVGAADVIQRLNNSLDAEWSFSVLEHEVLDDEAVVLGQLSASGVTKTQFGRSEITRRKRDRSPVSIGDDLKAAASDALKKCATQLGVGLHLYFQNGERRQNGQRQRTNGRGRTNGRRRPRANGRGQTRRTGSSNGNSRLTQRQLKAIFAIGRDLGMPDQEIRDFCRDMFGKYPDYLDRGEASHVIDKLQEAPGA